MGCDIHAYAEIKRSFGHEEARWYCCENFQLSPYYIWAKRNGKDLEGESEFEINPLYNGRNYALFEALAGVRGEMKNCLFAFQNDIPKDCSDFIKSEWEWLGEDAHSPSYITIKELFSKEAKPVVQVRGYLPKTEAHKLDITPGYVPAYWVETPTENYQEYREFKFASSPLEDFKKVYFESFKREMYYKYCDDEKVLNAILNSEQGDNYRIVFWFDN